jgi:ABC-type bacteriocin/lantibiotic exporter with double-glycine peptidase domain
MLKIFKLYKFLSKKQKSYFLLTFVGIIFCTFLEMISLSAIIPVFKLIFSNEKINFLFIDQLNKIQILFLFLFIFLFKNLFLIFFNFFYIKFIFIFSNQCSKKIFFNSLNQDYSFFKKNTSDNFLRKVYDDCSDMRVYIISCLIMIAEIIFLTSLAILLIFVDYRIFIVGFVFFSLSFILYFTLLNRRVKNWSYQTHLNNGNLQTLVNNGAKGIKDIIIYNLQNYFYRRFSFYSDNVFSPRFKVEFLNNVQRVWMELLVVTIFALSLILIINKGQTLEYFLPVFVLYGISLFRLTPSFNKIIINKQSYKFYYPGFESVVNQLNNFNIFLNEDKMKHFNFNKYIEFKNVSFKFEDTDNFLLENINLKIKKNSSNLIIGKNGSGKSTLLNIISGLMNPSFGDVLIDGEYNLRDFKKNWMSKIGFVQQEIFIIDSSLINNITLKEETPHDEIKLKNIFNSLKFDSVFDDFQELIKKKNILLDGFSLSGGQKQLISVARALYRETEVLIFDEPDSALDKKRTEILQKLLMSLKGSKTLIMISHHAQEKSRIFDNIIEISNKKITKIN